MELGRHKDDIQLNEQKNFNRCRVNGGVIFLLSNIHETMSILTHLFKIMINDEQKEKFSDKTAFLPTFTLPIFSFGVFHYLIREQ